MKKSKKVKAVAKKTVEVVKKPKAVKVKKPEVKEAVKPEVPKTPKVIKEVKKTGMPSIPSLKSFLLNACKKSAKPLSTSALLELLKEEQPERLTYKVTKYGSESEALLRLRREISSLTNANPEVFHKEKVDGLFVYSLIPKE
jgi:hypothetical protein